MTIKDLINNTEINDVITNIMIHYGDNEITDFQNLYNILKQMTPNKNVDETAIFIKAYAEGKEDDDILLDRFDENDSTIFFDVSATKQKNDGVVYSISNASYEDFLGFYVEEKTLEKMSYASILAHCLWEITAYYFEDRGMEISS